MALNVVSDVEAPSNDRQAAAQRLLQLALGALSKKALVAVSSLFTLTTVASAWVLWYSIPNPSTHQLVGLGMYGLFVLSVNTIVRRT